MKLICFFLGHKWCFSAKDPHFGTCVRCSRKFVDLMDIEKHKPAK